MNRRKFLLGTAVASMVYASDGTLIATVDEGFKLTPYKAGHMAWVWKDKVSEYMQAGYMFVHDDGGFIIKRKSKKFPNIMSYLMKKHG